MTSKNDTLAHAGSTQADRRGTVLEFLNCLTDDEDHHDGASGPGTDHGYSTMGPQDVQSGEGQGGRTAPAEDEGGLKAGDAGAGLGDDRRERLVPGWDGTDHSECAPSSGDSADNPVTRPLPDPRKPSTAGPKISKKKSVIRKVLHKRKGKRVRIKPTPRRSYDDDDDDDDGDDDDDLADFIDDSEILAHRAFLEEDEQPKTFPELYGAVSSADPNITPFLYKTVVGMVEHTMANIQEVLSTAVGDHLSTVTSDQLLQKLLTALDPAIEASLNKDVKTAASEMMLNKVLLGKQAQLLADQLAWPTTLDKLYEGLASRIAAKAGESLEDPLERIFSAIRAKVKKVGLGRLDSDPVLFGVVATEMESVLERASGTASGNGSAAVLSPNTTPTTSRAFSSLPFDTVSPRANAHPKANVPPKATLRRLNSPWQTTRPAASLQVPAGGTYTKTAAPAMKKTNDSVQDTRTNKTDTTGMLPTPSVSINKKRAAGDTAARAREDKKTKKCD